MLEPRATAIALLVVGIVLAACVLSTRLAARTGVPVFLLFVLLGLAAGEEGIGRIAFDDYGMAFRVGYAALVLILFDAGLNTPLKTFRRYLAPSLVLGLTEVVANPAIRRWAALVLFDVVAAFALLLAYLRATRSSSLPSRTGP